MFNLYIDLLVDTVDERRHKLVGFSIAEEPLLQNVFSGLHRSEMKLNKLDVVLPDPVLLLEMKINSLPNRTKDD